RRHLHRPISQSGVRRAIGANLLARARRHGGIRRSVVDREREAAAGGNRREPCCRARVDGASPPAAAAGAAVDVAQAWTVTTSSPCWRSSTARALSSWSRASRRPVAPLRGRVTAASRERADAEAGLAGGHGVDEVAAAHVYEPSVEVQLR